MHDVASFGRAAEVVIEGDMRDHWGMCADRGDCVVSRANDEPLACLFGER